MHKERVRPLLNGYRRVRIIGRNFLLREWRNWQTRYFEVVVRVTFWGFESPLSQTLVFPLL